MDKTTKPIRRRWNIFLLIGAFYWIILILTSLFVCSLSYEQKKSEILADVNIRLTQVGNAYQNLTEQFWESYLPIFENKTTSYLLLRDYFAVPDDDGLTPVELHDISNVLAQIVVRDDRIQWIAAYSPVRKVNYIYYAASQTGTGVGIMEALPDDLTGQPVFVVDPMLATGGSLLHAIRLLVERGATDITAVCMVSAQPGVDALAESGLPVRLVTATIDPELNADAYIVPGLGDAGDRLYGPRNIDL